MDKGGTRDFSGQTDFGKVKVSLKVFVDTLGLLRLKGRFENEALDYNGKYPLILRSLENSFFTKLILDSHNIRLKVFYVPCAIGIKEDHY